MPIVGIRVATLARVEWSANVLNTPIRHLEWMRWIGDIEQTEISIPILVAVSAWRSRVGIATGGHGGVGKRATQIWAMLDFKLVDAARAAGWLQITDLTWRGGIRHIPKHETAIGVRIVNRVAAVLDTACRNLMASERPIAGS